MMRHELEELFRNLAGNLSGDAVCDKRPTSPRRNLRRSTNFPSPLPPPFPMKRELKPKPFARGGVLLLPCPPRSQ